MSTQAGEPPGLELRRVGDHRSVTVYLGEARGYSGRPHEATIWSLGAKARLGRQPAIDCPYPDTRSARYNRRHWMAGWKFADEAIKQQGE